MEWIQRGDKASIKLQKEEGSGQRRGGKEETATSALCVLTWVWSSGE